MVNNPPQTTEEAAIKAAVASLQLRTLKPPRKLTDSNRAVDRSAAYDLSAVKTLTSLCGIAVVTDAAADDVMGISGRLTPGDVWDDEDIEHLIYALEPDDLHAVEWCNTSDQRVVLCDAYTICYSRKRRRRWEYGVKYYVKFGYDLRATVDVPTLIVSLHDAKY
ncbi:hypothetical protein [Burkholderia ubonensis]|uniref:hypothetical protein n=1 Tax=Burkholderia ubonensis TaxID=101571 RepID=UPI00075DC33F|nr:hypothetical protein [Burkholderia ubonensis]KVT35914.1 hypothetical protein WK48_30540 [Burkholderia ubonensis]KWB75452.1 hypothetical protein WL42_19550 [Burkholderia ubonensis]